MNEQIKEVVRQIIALLASDKYAEVETITHGVRLSAEEIETAITNYGRKLVIPPEEVFKLMDVIEVKNAQPKQWSIAMPLWTQEEGRSDLSLEMTVIQQQNGFAVSLDDLHVL